MTEPTPDPPKATAPTGNEKLESVVEDLLGVDFKLPRTIRDLVIRPNRVADAAVAHDRNAYTAQVKLFLALFALYTVIMGWAGVSEAYTLGALLAGQPEALADAQLAASGSSLAEADAVLHEAWRWSMYPINALASLLYVCVIWLMRRRIGWYAALMLYLVANNAGSIVSLPFMAAGALTGVALFAFAGLFTFVAFYAYAAVILYRRTADTIRELALEMLVFILAFIPITMIALLTVLTIQSVAMFAATGHWPLDVLSASIAAARTQ